MKRIKQEQHRYRPAPVPDSAGQGHYNALDQRNQAQEQDDTYAVLALSVSFCAVNVKAKDQSCKAFWLNNPGLFIGACATAPCMLYTLYKPFTCYLLFCPVGVSGRRYTLPERS